MQVNTFYNILINGAKRSRTPNGINAKDMKENGNKKMDTKVEKHIDVLDGVRAVAMVFVVWFHFWQQSWLTPPGKLEGFVRYGFVFVDLLILLSAFCNFYPYARAILLQEPWPDTKTFYKKRAARILPSYYLSLLVMIVVLLAEGVALTGAFWKDFVAHIFCVGPLFADSYLSRYFNGVLWTVQIEVLYYVFLPWLARLFRRFPVLTCVGLWVCGLASAGYIVSEKADMIRIYGNHIATFAGCYANGMLLCMLYIILKRMQAEKVSVQNEMQSKCIQLAATGVVVICTVHLSGMLAELGNGELQVIQLQQRFELSFIFSCFILALSFAWKGVQWLFANCLMKWIAAISYNLYIWHQYIAVKLKEYRIPYWEGDTPPNMTGDRAWMWKYQIWIVVLSLLVAIVMTYGFEKPLSGILLGKASGKQRE